MRHVLMLLLGLVLSSAAMAAEDPTSTDLLGQGPPGTKSATTLGAKEAEQLIAEGNLAMRKSTSDPDRIVDAAFAFSQALKFFEKSGDLDRICDLKANLYWCQKHMNPDLINRFLALKNGGKEVEEAKAILAKVDEVVNKQVPPEEAKDYFARAEKFAQQNPDQHLNIAIRYREVAERFQATEFGPKAMKLSLEAQDRYAKTLQAERTAWRETLFSKPSKPSTDVTQVAVPSADSQKTALATLKKVYKDDYAKRQPNQRKRLVAKLMDQAQTTKDDPVMLYCLLNEAVDKALEVGDYQAVIAAIDLKAAGFTDSDALAQKKAAFGKAKGNPIAATILKLLDNPADVEANTVVGRYFCCEVGKWDLGLPMLAQGNDAGFKAAAEMELLKPSSAAQQVELGDKWYELGKKAKHPEKERLLARAVSWYKQAEPRLSGISQKRVQQRSEEIYQLVPEAGLDFDHITVKQWERLLGKSIEVKASSQTNDIGLVLPKDTKVRIVPHPTDTWTMHYERWIWSNGAPNIFDTDATGMIAKENGRRVLSQAPSIIIGQIQVVVGTGAPVGPGVIVGEGKVTVGPQLPGGGNGEGKIRIKVLALDDD